MKTENMGSKKVIDLSMTELFAGIGAQTRAKNNLLANKDIIKQIKIHKMHMRVLDQLMQNWNQIKLRKH